MKLTENQIEDVFEKFYKELISNELTLKARQVKMNNLRADLYFVDKNGKDVIVELKREPVSREDIGQLIQYAGTVENSKVLLIAPVIPPAIKTAFEHYGIDYREFNLSKIEELYERVTNLGAKKSLGKKEEPIIQSDYMKIPNRIRDGNISFKVSYNDKNWGGICSQDVYRYNCFSNHKMYWCSLQAPKCQNFEDSALNKDSYPCYDSVANLCTQFTPGWNHGKDAPHICLEAKVGKIAVLTSLFPGSSQDSRFIFSLFEIDRVEKIQEHDIINKGTEFYIGKPDTAIKLEEDQYLNYWDYSTNKTDNDRFKKYWGSGLFRYLDDKIVSRILSTIILSPKYSSDQKRNAGMLMTKVC